MSNRKGCLRGEGERGRERRATCRWSWPVSSMVTSAVDIVRVDAVVSAAAPVTARYPGRSVWKASGKARRSNVPVRDPKAAPPTKVGRKTPVGVGIASERGESTRSFITP